GSPPCPDYNARSGQGKPAPLQPVPGPSAAPNIAQRAVLSGRGPHGSRPSLLRCRSPGLAGFGAFAVGGGGYQFVFFDREALERQEVDVGKRLDHREALFADVVGGDQNPVELGCGIYPRQLVERAEYLVTVNQLALLERVVVDEADQTRPPIAVREDVARGRLPHPPPPHATHPSSRQRE